MLFHIERRTLLTAPFEAAPVRVPTTKRENLASTRTTIIEVCVLLLEYTKGKY